MEPMQPSAASLTCLLAGEGKDNDVVKRPGVVGVWWVEGQVPGCSLTQVDEESRVHHGNRKAAPAVSFSDGDVGGSALVVALQEDGGLWSGVPEHTVGSVKASKAGMGHMCELQRAMCSTVAPCGVQPIIADMAMSTGSLLGYRDQA